jgi:hypothetical protein
MSGTQLFHVTSIVHRAAAEDGISEMQDSARIAHDVLAMMSSMLALV